MTAMIRPRLSRLMPRTKSFHPTRLLNKRGLLWISQARAEPQHLWVQRGFYRQVDLGRCRLIDDAFPDNAHINARRPEMADFRFERVHEQPCEVCLVRLRLQVLVSLIGDGTPVEDLCGRTASLSDSDGGSSESSKDLNEINES